MKRHKWLSVVANALFALMTIWPMVFAMRPSKIVVVMGMVIVPATFALKTLQWTLAGAYGTSGKPLTAANGLLGLGASLGLGWLFFSWNTKFCIAAASLIGIGILSAYGYTFYVLSAPKDRGSVGERLSQGRKTATDQIRKAIRHWSHDKKYFWAIATLGLIFFALMTAASVLESRVVAGAALATFGAFVFIVNRGILGFRRGMDHLFCGKEN